MELRFFSEIFCNISATFGINLKKELAISWRIKYNRRRLILFLCVHVQRRRKIILSVDDYLAKGRCVFHAETET